MSDSEFAVQEVVVEVQFNARPETVWQSITEDIGAWWPRDCAVDPAATFRLDARLGGLMFEDAGDGEGTIWGTVTHVKRNVCMRLSAEIWPEFGGPARSIQRYDLTGGESGTTLRFTDTLFGKVTAKTGQSMKEGWEFLFGDALKRHVESRGT